MLGIGAGEAVFLVVLGLIILGPEKLPRVAAEVVRLVRTVRRMADSAREEMRGVWEPELAQMRAHADDDFFDEVTTPPLNRPLTPPMTGPLTGPLTGPSSLPLSRRPGGTPPYDADAT